MENKLNARVGYKQLERYHRTLESKGCGNTRLALISKYPLPSTEYQPDLVIRWFQIGEWLKEMIETEEMGETSSFLVRQFLVFLRECGLAFRPPRSSLSKSIQAYFTSAGEHNVIELGKVHSLKALSQIPDLVPLADLLHSVKDAIQAIRPKARVSLWSGKSGWQGSAWIAYNLDKADLFVSLYLHEPDVLAFESHRRRINPALVREGQGRLFTSWGRQRWRRTLDLAAPDLCFYAASQPAQQAILEEFLRDCFRMLDEISESS
jgi:hypothetical protein